MIDYIYSDANKPLKMIVWDLGRRCNFDCTYCTGWMHSTTAPFNDFEEYKKTAEFIHKYYSLYKKYHKVDWDVMISFTGGEPAINPAFYKLVPYLKENYPYMKLNLTTNGAWSKNRGQFLLDNMNSITVSYHCEGTDKQKALVRDNLLWVRENIPDPHKLKVNVMMHMDYFDETVDLIENFLKPNDIRYIPRTIGDDAKFRSKWFKDMDGNMRRTSHVYTPDQLDYIKNHWNTKNKEVEEARVKRESQHV
jgi:molybdenum cofactor biosynthesis enzyme MoaA